MDTIIGKTHLILETGDITKQKVDAIVNAANPSLRGGSGVDGAIHRAGGGSILKECQAIITKIGRLAPGKAVITGGGKLPAKYVIHTVGPVWRDGNNREAETLASAYRESLVLVEKMALKTVAFPAISTGAYGFPLPAAAEIALTEIKKHLLGATGLEKVFVLLFSSEAYTAHLEVLKKL